MDGKTAIDQLVAYTKDVYKHLNLRFNAGGRRNYREWDEGHPTGHIVHFTASNAAITKKRPLGRLPVLLRRFAVNSGSPGVHFITWDGLLPELASIRAKYDIFKKLKCDVFCWGLDVAFYHANSANRWAFGIEHRNIGRLQLRKDGTYGWGRGSKIDYVGRTPISIRGFWCEPFTLAQIDANVRILRWIREMHPIEAMKVTGHENIISNRTDPSPHFPLKLVRDLSFSHTSLEVLEKIYKPDDEFFERYDEWMEEEPVEDLDNTAEWFARTGQAETCKLDDGDEDELGVIKGDIYTAKSALVQLGYWPLSSKEQMITSEVTPEFTWSLKMFQNRWVIRKHKRWVRLLKITGTPDAPTIRKLNQMLRQWRHIP